MIDCIRNCLSEVRELKWFAYFFYFLFSFHHSFGRCIFECFTSFFVYFCHQLKSVKYPYDKTFIRSLARSLWLSYNLHHFKCSSICNRLAVWWMALERDKFHIDINIKWFLISTVFRQKFIIPPQKKSIKFQLYTFFHRKGYYYSFGKELLWMAFDFTDFDIVCHLLDKVNLF